VPAPGITPPEKLKVVVSILPQAYFVERVGGDRVEVEVLVGPGQSPHSYELTPRQLEALSQAQVCFRIGIDFEETLVPRIERLFRQIRVVDTRVGVPLRGYTPQEEHAELDHGEHHGPTGRHPSPTTRVGRPDPHIWLSPPLVKIQARTICSTLCELDPEHADQYRKNLAEFEADLDRVHARIVDALAPLRGQAIFVYHPAFGYFADTYGLRQIPVEIEGKEPTAKQLASLIERARAAGAKVIFVQPQFPKKAAEAVAEAIGGVVVPLDDLSRDYLRNLEEIAARIKAGLSKGSE